MSTCYRQAQAGLIFLACLATPTHAQQQGGLVHPYPNKPIRMLVGIPPGGGIDIVARTIAQSLAERWGQTVLVDNRTGAGGAIAMELATQAAPDGYTLLAGSPALSPARHRSKRSLSIRAKRMRRSFR